MQPLTSTHTPLSTSQVAPSFVVVKTCVFTEKPMCIIYVLSCHIQPVLMWLCRSFGFWCRHTTCPCDSWMCGGVPGSTGYSGVFVGVHQEKGMLIMAQYVEVHCIIKHNSRRACARGYCTWSVCLSVCLSVCYHYFSETVSLYVVLKVPNGSGRHSAEFYKNRFLYKRFIL